jgi:hypothetical protein
VELKRFQISRNEVFRGVMFENMVLKRILGHERDEVTGQWR